MLDAAKKLLAGLLGRGPAKQAVADAQMAHWTDAEVEEAHQRLKGIPSGSWSKQNHYDALDFVVQAHLPPDANISQALWLQRQAELREKLDRNLALGRHEAAGDAARRAPSQRYRLTRENFDQVVLPALARFPCASDIARAPEGVRHALWAATRGLGDEETLGSRHDRAEAVSTLAYAYPKAVQDIASALRANYEVLRNDQLAGYADAKVVVPARCTCLRELLDGRVMPVDGLLAAYERAARADGLEGAARSAYPLLPPAETPCARVEACARVCSVRLVPRELVFPEDDANFAKYLDGLLGGATNGPLPSGWREALRKRSSENGSGPDER